MAGKNSGIWRACGQFRLDRNRGGDDILPIRYVSVRLVSGWMWVSLGSVSGLGRSEGYAECEG